ncbi:MAG: prohibitin family protein [Bacilli bacterium]|nr:prohibitin family protein [Bacilli bacterium]
MIWLSLSIITTISLMVLIGVYCKQKSKKVFPLILIGLMGLLLVIPGCITTIATGEVGIKTTWGKITNTNMKEGIQFKYPWQDVIKMNIKVQKYENEKSMETSTKDMQVVKSVIVSVNYQLDEDKVTDMYRQVGQNYNAIVLEPAIQESIKSAISQYNAEELVTKRNEVSDKILETLSIKVQDYGLKIISVSLKNFDFSTEYNASIERKTIAEQNALTAEQELKTSEANAKKKVIEAQAEADANKIKNQTITDEILTQQFIEKWNGELPKVMGEGNIFNVSELIK